MKKHTEKPPIDDLFARKLGNMSLPTDPRGFERLQGRMGQNRSETRVVFWHNPAMQRYMATAACLLLVCLFGWLYWPSGAKTTPAGPQIATKQALPVRPQKPVEKQSDTSIPDVVGPAASNQPTNNERLAKIEKISGSENGTNRSGTQSVVSKKTVLHPDAPVRNEPVLAQTKPAETMVNPEVSAPDNVLPTNQATQEQVAENKATTKPSPTVERVLVVTIEEPTSLVAARQAAKSAVEEKPVVAINDKPEKEAKSSGLWQQVKRLKQGELFARRDNVGNDDRGLLGRAYDGLKHSFDKDKSTK